MKTSYETQAELACKALRSYRETFFVKREREEFLEMLGSFEKNELKKTRCGIGKSNAVRTIQT